MARFRSGLLAVALVVAAGCEAAEPDPPGPAPSPDPEVVRIAFLADLSREEATERTAPAFQGAKLAVETAVLTGDLPVEVELVEVDAGDPEATAEVADDPSFVGAIVAPWTVGRDGSADALDTAGVPTVSLSSLDPGSVRGTVWRRAVASLRREAAALAELVDGMGPSADGVCSAGGGGVVAARLLRAVTTSLEAPVLVRARVPSTEAGARTFADAVALSGCGVVVWGGRGAGGAFMRRHLASSGLRRVAFVGGSGMKEDTFVEAAGRSAEGAMAVCSCADLTTSTALAAQRFVQDYQSYFGLPPGPFAVEGWDVAGMFLEAVRVGATTREAVSAALRAPGPHEGLANTYVFGPDGALSEGSALVHLYGVEGGRWLLLEGG